ncbi:MAG TPA: S8 family serine peptidase [Acidimicrobiales bacterium]|nr:S8 family serine peptidase [Acidimicrobiales bacterium]
MAVGLVAVGLPVHAANDGGAAQLWNMRTVGAEAAWSTGTGKGVTIAIVDTGVHLTHEDLAGKLVPGQNFVTDGTAPQDDNGHGTHVAGIAAAIANNRVGVFGVAPDVRIMPVRVLHGPGGRGSGEDVEAGIRWAADNGAQVINLSLGEDLQGLPLMSPTFADSVEYAFRKGAICVVAAGNDALRSSGFTTDTNALIVTATTQADTKASYASDVGALLNGTPKWGMAAPGGAGGQPNEDDILSTFWTSAGRNDQYAWAAGTSMAAPHVAGAAAILRGLGLSAEQAAARLTATAKDLGAAGPDDTYGHGRLDVAKAVAGLQPAGGTSGSGGGGGGGSTGAGGGASATTTTTSARGSARNQNSSPTSAKGQAGAPTTSSTAGGGDAGTASVAPSDEDGVDADEVAAAQKESEGGGASGGGGNDTGTVWPIAVLALAALAGAGGAAARLRRHRV